MGKTRPAVILLSGGLDSTTVAAMAQAEGFQLHAITFRYGQRHTIEIDAAKRVASGLGIDHHVIADIDLRMFGGSALTSSMAVPKNNSVDDLQDEIPVTYVPARNTIFLSFALALAEVVCAADIFVGVNAVDYSGYPDCRPEYIESFERLANLATKSAVGGQRMTIRAPLIDMSKSQIIRRGLELGIDYQWTTSCYDPAENGNACGHCDACLLRLQGFDDAGSIDPVKYASSSSHRESL